MKRITSILILLALPIPVISAMITVNWDGTGDYTTIQTGINAALNGDTIIVADGTYTGPGNRDILFQGKAITVKSKNGPENCIIDCQRLGRGFLFGRNDDDNSVIDGFTITNGYAHSGGAIFCGQEPPALTIKNCIITGNEADWNGGGIFGWGGNIRIVNCTITNNSASFGGGIGNCSGVIDQCVISNNFATEIGGGIDCQFSSPKVFNSIITNNTVQSGRGGGIHCWASTAILVNCTIAGNRVIDGAGGGICCKYRGNPTIINCILYANTAVLGPEIAVMDYVSPSNPTVLYSNIKGGQNNIYIQPGCSLDWGQGNIDTDPCFVKPGYWDNNSLWVEGDYHLLADSRCIDAGDNSVVTEATDLDGNPRIVDGDNNGTATVDMGAYEFFVPAIIQVIVDIKPGSCPNPLRVNFIGQGVLPVAIVGSENFDVLSIDVDTITLHGVGPIRSSYKDVSTFGAEACECTTLGPDGFLDLELKFKREDILTALEESVGELTLIPHRTQLPLTLSAMLMDEDILLEGTDCLTILNRGAIKRKKK